jgi:hypothetical protein
MNIVTNENDFTKRKCACALDCSFTEGSKQMRVVHMRDLGFKNNFCPKYSYTRARLFVRLYSYIAISVCRCLYSEIYYHHLTGSPLQSGFGSYRTQFTVTTVCVRGETRWRIVKKKNTLPNIFRLFEHWRHFVHHDNTARQFLTLHTGRFTTCIRIITPPRVN